MEKLSEIDGFKKLYAYFESNKVRQEVKKSVSDISSLPTDFRYEDIPKMSDRTIKGIILSNHDIYGNSIIASIVSGMISNYFGAFNTDEENRTLKKTDKYLSLYTEYILRQIRKCRDEFRILGIPKDKIKKVLDTEAIVLDEDEKYELFKNIFNLQIANYNPKDKKKLNIKQLQQDSDFQDFIKQVRVIIFGNVIEFTDSSLISEKEGLLDIFDLRHYKANGISTSSRIIGLKGNVKINLVSEKQEDETYNTYLHELCHSAEGFITNIIGELISNNCDNYDVEKELGKSKIFKGMEKEDILNDFEWLKIKIPQLYNFIFGIDNINKDIEIGYLNINKEFIAQLIGTSFFYGKGEPTAEELANITEDLSLRLINYIKPFSILLNYTFADLEKHFDILSDEHDRIIELIGKYFNIVFQLVAKQMISFIKLSDIRGNRQMPFMELGFIPLNKWESYIRLQGKKTKK